jgi:hypothetical protein
MVGITTLIIFVAGTAGLYFLAQLSSKKALIAGAALAFAFVLPHLWFTKETDGYLPLFTIVLCAVYALFALGLNIVVASPVFSTSAMSPSSSSVPTSAPGS